MKTKYIKQLFSAALIAVLSSGVTSCINDLDISPIDPQTGGSFDQQERICHVGCNRTKGYRRLS